MSWWFSSKPKPTQVSPAHDDALEQDILKFQKLIDAKNNNELTSSFNEWVDSLRKLKPGSELHNFISKTPEELEKMSYEELGKVFDDIDSKLFYFKKNTRDFKQLVTLHSNPGECGVVSCRKFVESVEYNLTSDIDNKLMGFIRIMQSKRGGRKNRRKTRRAGIKKRIYKTKKHSI